jgi:hypothetical protein
MTTRSIPVATSPLLPSTVHANPLIPSVSIMLTVPLHSPSQAPSTKRSETTPAPLQDPIHPCLQVSPPSLGSFETPDSLQDSPLYLMRWVSHPSRSSHRLNYDSPQDPLHHPAQVWPQSRSLPPLRTVITPLQRKAWSRHSPFGLVTTPPHRKAWLDNCTNVVQSALEASCLQGGPPRVAVYSPPGWRRFFVCFFRSIFYDRTNKPMGKLVYFHISLVHSRVFG